MIIPSLAKEGLVKLYVLVNGNTHKPVIYEIDSVKYIFIIGEKEWDRNGWKGADGFAFKEKLFVLGVDTNGVWKQISLIQNIWYRLIYRAISPKYFSLRIKNKKIELYIKDNYKPKELYKFRRSVNE